ncbi:MAG TPA: YceI family protein [Gammaproteobacteria bacterium]|nr:YceI family protein [Gammaproteobacteria bacterium]
MRKAFIPLWAALLLAACQTAPVTVGAGSTPPTLPLPQPAAGAVHYAVDATRSDVRFLVYKAGPLAAFGYDHVIRARGIQGDVYLASDFPASSFSLVLPVKDFEVDAPEARAVEGPDFAKQPSPQAVQGTTEHMLGPEELDAEHYPEVRIQSVHLVGPEWGPDVTLRVTLHGTVRDLTVPIALSQAGDDLVATGSLQILQSEFGIKPHAALGGGLAVGDLVRVRFRITAHKV